MRLRSTKVAGLALAVAGITALAACSSSGSSSGGGNNNAAKVTVPGGIGSIPVAAAGAKVKAGTITWGMQPGATPNWIFPVIPSAQNSVYNAFTFIWEMWRPLYWQTNGVVPEIEQNMSVADLPQYSNGNKTVTITLKSNYKWSDGKPMTADDLLFFIDLAKAGIKISPANWATYTPKFFPDNLVSTSEPNSTTLVLNLKSPVNPSWFTEDILTSVNPLPSTLWAKTSASGSVVPSSGWNPSTMKSIFNYLTAQAKSLNTYTTNPLWQVVNGPYKLSQYNTTTGAFTMTPNKTYGGPHVTPMSNFQGVPFTSDSAYFNAVKSKSIDVARIRLDLCPATAPGAEARLQHVRRAELRDELRGLQLRGQDQPLQQHRLAAVLPAGDVAPGGPAGLDQRVPARRGRAGVRPHPGLPEEPVPALQRGDQPVSVQRQRRDQPAEEPRLDDQRRRYGRLPERGQRPQPVRSGHPGRHAAEVQPDLRLGYRP